MSSIDVAIADAKSAEEVIAAFVPVVTPFLPAAVAGPVGAAVTLTGAALVALQALVAWAEKQGNLAQAAAVEAVEVAVDVQENAKFPPGA